MRAAPATFKRRYERVPFFCDLTLLATGAVHRACAVDLSLGGVGVATTAFAARGQTVRVAFHLRDARQQPRIEEVIGRVAFCRADEDGNFLGVEFLEPLRATEQPELTRRLEKL
jgi:hypothetical protein